MPIDTTCPSCGRTLRVADQYAGQQARCPVCQSLYMVPSLASDSSPPASAAPAGPTEPPCDSTRWSMKTPEGAMYGPVDRDTLEQWLADGRIANDCYLAAGESGRWQPAAEIFPQLSPDHVKQTPPNRAPSSNPFEDTPRASTVGYQGVPGNVHQRPHRGGLILALGILGLISCQVLGVIAWVMGSDDLKEIRAGRMDPEGEGLTQAGTVLGMICTIMLAIGLVTSLLMLLIFALIAAMQ